MPWPVCGPLWLLLVSLPADGPRYDNLTECPACGFTACMRSSAILSRAPNVDMCGLGGAMTDEAGGAGTRRRSRTVAAMVGGTKPPAVPPSGGALRPNGGGESS